MSPNYLLLAIPEIPYSAFRYHYTRLLARCDMHHNFTTLLGIDLNKALTGFIIRASGVYDNVYTVGTWISRKHGHNTIFLKPECFTQVNWRREV